ncbi:MAG: PEGA domain-containing protein [Myxococcales bacterium]|nr:PEGA domain-containing protein [Myxococcales bacterium]
MKRALAAICITTFVSAASGALYAQPAKPAPAAAKPAPTAAKPAPTATKPAPAPAAAKPAPAAAKPAPRRASVALLRLDALGLEPEIVSRLEALFRLEVERLAGATLPSAREVDDAMARDARLRACAGEVECLALVGTALGVEQVISGNIGSLGDSYMVNLKLVDATKKQELRRVAQPLRGNADELIEAVRLAAYRLVAPERIRGSIAIVSDVNGATVFVDGKRRGKTPLATAIGGLNVGKHGVRLNARGHTDYLGEVEVRFQKTSHVVVNLVVVPGTILDSSDGASAETDRRWWQTTRGWIGIGVGAAVLGVLVGLSLGEDTIVVDCAEEPAQCTP